MDRKELLDQYDRFIDQVRLEIKDLYWLYNFFFVVESATLGSFFMGKINHPYETIAEISGLFLSIYWFIIIRKKRLWRNNWVSRIQIIEKKLEYDDDLQMWPARKSKRVPKDYLVGRKGMWRFLFALPICFGIIWIVLLTFY